MFMMGCQDAVPSVSKAALAATSAFIVEIGNEQEVMIMEKVLTPMVQNYPIIHYLSFYI